MWSIKYGTYFPSFIYFLGIFHVSCIKVLTFLNTIFIRGLMNPLNILNTSIYIIVNLSCYLLSVPTVHWLWVVRVCRERWLKREQTMIFNLHCLTMKNIFKWLEHFTEPFSRFGNFDCEITITCKGSEFYRLLI